MSAGIEYLNGLDRESLVRHERNLLSYAEERLGQEVKSARIVGQAENKASVLSFVMDEAHPHDIGTFLDLDGIAIRSGHHCTQPIMKQFGLSGTARASFAFYNTFDEVDRLMAALVKVEKFFA